MLEFEPNTLAFMTAALEQTCRQLKDNSPESRKLIADRLMECARSGKVTMADLAEAGQRAIAELNKSDSSFGRWRRMLKIIDKQPE